MVQFLDERKAEKKGSLSSKKNKLKVPYFGRHKAKKYNRNLPNRVGGDVNNLRSGSMISNNSSKISTASSKSSVSNNRNDLSLLQIAGTNINRRQGGPKKNHRLVKYDFC